MTDRDKKIMEYMGEPEMLSQLAEECCELGQAALKLRRVLDKKNPTPVTEEEARANLVEEAADVYNALGFLLNVEDHINAYNIIQRKKDRWLGRLEENVMAEVVAETKEAVHGKVESLHFHKPPFTCLGRKKKVCNKDGYIPIKCVFCSNLDENQNGTYKTKQAFSRCDEDWSERNE